MAIPQKYRADQYVLGKGVLWMAPWTTTYPTTGAPTSYNMTATGTGGWYDVGNCTSFEVELTVEKLAHFTSRDATRTKDKEIVLESGYKVTFTLDQISLYNLKMFLRGTMGTAANTEVIQANMATASEYALIFFSQNPATSGHTQKWTFRKVSLAPNGALSLIGDDWMQMSFTGEGLYDTTATGSKYFDVKFSTTSGEAVPT